MIKPPSIAPGSDPVEAVRGGLSATRRLLHGSGAPQRRQSATPFDPAFLNLAGGIAPGRLAEALQRNGHGRLCFYGPPGTGKTEFAHVLADALGRELVVKTTSDLVSKYVGETERNLAALFHGVVVREDSRGDRSVSRLANADATARHEQRQEGGRQPGRAAGQTPHDHADAHQHPARVALRQPGEGGRADHVHRHERRGQKTEAGVVGFETDVLLEPIERQTQRVLAPRKIAFSEEGPLDRPDDGRQHVAIDVVEQVDQEQEDERRARAGKTSRTRGPARTAASARTISS